MFKPLVKLLLSKLDRLVDAYLERQRSINLIAIPGTLLFLILFWAFSGAGGAVLVLGLFLVIVELALAGGLYVLNEKYAGEIRQSNDVADAIEAYLSGSDVFGEWKQFLETPLTNPDLEEIRDHCTRLPADFPPEGPAEHCNEQGLSILESYASELRVGIATKFHRDFSIWRSARRAAKAQKKVRIAEAAEEITLRTNPDVVRQKEVAAAVKHVPTLNPGAFLDDQDQKRVEKEAAKEAKKAVAEAKKEAKQADKAASKVAKKAIKVEKRQQKKATAIPDMPEMPDLPDETIHQEATTFAPPAPPPPPPAPPKKTKKQARGLTEAGAIQEVMRAGYTAHHYDQAQQTLTRRPGRAPSPKETVKALLANNWGKGPKGKKSKKKKGKSRKVKMVAAPKAPKVYTAPDDYSERPGRLPWMRFIVLLGLLGGAPFGAWRLEKPKAGPVIITGQVYHQVLDHAPDVQHKLRTPFEEFIYGNLPITIVDGPRIYVSPEDYDICWPEAWEDIYEKGYSIMITAEAKPLLIGGYSVARITKHHRVERPLASADE